MTGTTTQEALAVDGLQMRYGATDVLHDVSFRAHRGEVLALLGPNGAGKSTTIEILEGFRMRSGGRVSVLGTDPAHGDEAWRARVGVVLQSWRDHPKWRVREFLDYQGRYYAPYATGSIGRPWDTAKLLAAVGLSAQANTAIRMLSGGQRRRLDVAVGVIGKPELVFLDEPTAGLDPEARREFHDLVRALVDTLGTTVLITTHDLDEAEKIADRIIILAKGRIVANGTAAELAQTIAGEDEVRWVHEGQRFSRSTPDSTAFARDLFARYEDKLEKLEVHRASLENTYLTLVHQAERGRATGETLDQKAAV